MDDQTPAPFGYQVPDGSQDQSEDSRAADVPDNNDQPPAPTTDNDDYDFAAAAEQAAAPLTAAKSQYDNTAAPASALPPAAPSDTGSSPNTVYSGLSGNELYCLDLIGYRPGNLLVGNSVYALGVIGGIASNVRTTIGGEIQQFTNMIASGRQLSLQRLEQELAEVGGHGATGVTSELVFHPGHVEFLSIGSSIYRQDNQAATSLTTSADGQEFYCQVDAGYMPIRFVLGNVAYSIGIGRNLLGELRQLAKGEISQYSNVFNTTRNLALERIVQEARDCGANSIIGIRTTILPIGSNGVQEMVMIGTASYNPEVAAIANEIGGVLTSDLTAEETWNVTRLGYVPLKLILGTSVYSIGVVGGLRAALRGVARGEITTLTQMIYGAREESLKKVQQQAEEIGADDVLGIKTYIYQLGGDVIEFLAIGTAVKRVSGVAPRSDQIPPQAIIRDKNTFINAADMAYNTTLNQPSVEHQDEKGTV